MMPAKAGYDDLCSLAGDESSLADGSVSFACLERRTGACDRDQPDRDYLERAKRLPQHDEARERRDRGLEAHQHANTWVGSFRSAASSSE
jgi:hypothetical protein